MKSLTELVDFINTKFSQENIPLCVFDFNKKKNIVRPQPKFLYRGERTNSWKETKSTFCRNLYLKSNFDEINHWISGIHPKLGIQTNHNSLYFFLRDSTFGVSAFEEHNNPDIEKSILGLLQHYDFDTSFFDLTSDLKVAAFFASYGATPGNIGQIMVIATSTIENKYFDLTDEIGNRPSVQSSFVLWGTTDLDLKSKSFLEQYKVSWFEFMLNKEDKLKFGHTDLLSTKSDIIAKEILAWYDCYINDNHALTVDTMEYFKNKVENLKKWGL